ncbi:PREDICTED: claw keratin-like [Nipponia nippon]|nr:PREDICTED: claw keratin-like [Nipponia nippon]
MSCASLCIPSCGVAAPAPLADTANEPCVRQCPDSVVVIQPPASAITFPGPILSSFPQYSVVGSVGAPGVGGGFGGTFGGRGGLGGLGGFGSYGGLGGYGGYGLSGGYGGYGLPSVSTSSTSCLLPPEAEQSFQPLFRLWQNSY